ncbi:Kinase, AGC PKA [Giardia muris]|uniref:Kinase, AGC PKA n=1 Tax=Giardia muris TaxID=5742 RepID=A0A4Z1SMT2_GIAMU|nr:Kinase, AGC PKA [Giardia muris]|eukprot:TNJ26996.1 Kinase, AGC PKA [Giardia muris]
MPADAADEITLSTLEHIRNVSSGSFGRVSLRRHIATGEYYAVKSISKRKLIALQQVTHVRDECMLLASLDSPFIVKQHALLQDDRNIHIVLDFIQGGELFYHLRRRNKFPPEVAKFYAAEVLMAIGHMHKQGIVYRDLKLENILLDRKGHVKIVDLGFAKRIVDPSDDGEEMARLCFSIVGTPEYLPPETIRSTGHDMSADWWAFGILLYEMIVGRPPFYNETPELLYREILQGRLEFPPNFPTVAADLVKRLLDPDKAKRLGSSLTTGTEDVMKHPFFSNIDWKWFARQEVRTPITPKIKDPTDTAYYKDYLDENGDFEPEDFDFDGPAPPPDLGFAEVPHTQEDVDAFFKDYPFTK